MVKILRFSVRRLKGWFRRRVLRYRIESRHPGVSFAHSISWVNDEPGAIEFGNNVSIGPFCEIVVLASDPKSRVAGGLRVGHDSVIGALSNVRATGGLIQIGNHCLIGQGVSLIASNHQYKAGHIYWQLPWDETKTGVTVGNNVWVGCGVIILPGCVIGDNAIIGAGSVVTKSVPPATIWAGNPARQLRTIT